MRRITALLAVIALLSGFAALPAAAQDKMESGKMESGKMHATNQDKMGGHMTHAKSGSKMASHKMQGQAHHRTSRTRGHTMMSNKTMPSGKMTHSSKMMHSSKMTPSTRVKEGSTEGGKM